MNYWSRFPGVVAFLCVSTVYAAGAEVVPTRSGVVFRHVDLVAQVPVTDPPQQAKPAEEPERRKSEGQRPQVTNSAVRTEIARVSGERLGNSESYDAAMRTSVGEKGLQLSIWIELVAEDGSEGARVAPDRIFHSGERIRLHFEGSATGYISIMQFDEQGAAVLLYPDSRRAQGDNMIRAYADCVFPVPPAWFRFDGNPGSERLLVLYSTDRGKASVNTMTADVGARMLGKSLGAGVHGAKILRLGGPGDPNAENTITASNPESNQLILSVVLQHQ